MPSDPRQPDLEHASGRWGDDPRLRTVVLGAIGALMMLGVGTFAWLVEDRWRDGARWLGIPVIPAPDPPKAGAPLRLGDIQSLFGDPGNYPTDAAEKGEQGTAVASLGIAPSGVVMVCRIKESSGSASLDAATCRLFRKIRAEPPRDRNGVALPATITLRFQWRLPEP